MSTTPEVAIETIDELTTTPREAAPVTPVTVAAVGIKLPPFWPADPHVWFAQVEAQFNTRGITTQKTRFDHVITSELAVEVRDLLIRPPADTPLRHTEGGAHQANGRFGAEKTTTAHQWRGARRQKAYTTPP